MSYETFTTPDMGTRIRYSANPASVTWWWTPDCGHLHASTDPVVLNLTQCPDGFANVGEDDPNPDAVQPPSVPEVQPNTATPVETAEQAGDFDVGGEA